MKAILLRDAEVRQIESSNAYAGSVVRWEADDGAVAFVPLKAAELADDSDEVALIESTRLAAERAIAGLRS